MHADLTAKKRVLIMTAVMAERDAVLRGLHKDQRFEVRVAGVGPVAAAVSTAKVLATEQYDLVVSAGIGGGFPEVAEVGSLVVANQIIAADLGAETPEGFLSLDELGFGSACLPVDISLAQQVSQALRAAKLPVHLGPVLTVSTVTGTAATSAEMAVRVPEAAAEGMEGYGIAWAAQDSGVPFLEIRAISNSVGPRDRDLWRIPEALDILATTCSILSEVL